MKSFNPILWLLCLSPLTFLMVLLFGFLSDLLKTQTLFNLTSLVIGIQLTNLAMFLVSFFLFIIGMVLLGIEIVDRYRNNELGEYFASIIKTIRFRGYLTQYDKNPPIQHTDRPAALTINPVIQSVNRSVRKTVIDVRPQTATICIPLPKDQQGQKILKEMGEQIKEEISSQFEDYYFSSPRRIKNELWFIGQRR